ncbi:c-type cytochrome [Azonexus sp.]|uniref:c-type cytochrome n=1 Tax=Azonexus sp. TaxID=1872668 RepID=UPI0027BA680E|nr:c-type cytochrome [Azonexus sp.]
MRAFLLLAGLLASAPLFAQAQTAAQERMKAIQADPAALQAAVTAGKKASFFCANCHGEGGVAKTTDVPNLAGQNPGYLLEQIRKFGSGERKDQFMQGLIKVLKDEERVQIALYYASVTVPPSRADATQVARGKVMFDKLCARCHGENARGHELYPRLAGQQQPYLQKSITHYRDGTGIRNNQLMSIATAPLKNEDIVALSHYLTQLP